MTTTISTARAMNFNPGPAALPLPVLERAREELIDFASTGLSIMEHSHRGKAYEAVHDEAIALLRELLGISDAYDVLLLQGGASQQFAQLPMNFLGRGLGSGAYVLTGSWSEKAYAEAQLVAAMLGGEATVAASTGTGEGKNKQYTRVPAAPELHIAPHAAYVHLTSNETIHGVQFAAEPGADFPDVGQTPLFCDMSSDFLWRAFDVNRFAVIYAGAQKNVGPSGVVMVVIRKDLVAAGRMDVPVIFQYRTHAASNSLYNTPPTFGVYLVRGVLQWVKENGGLAQIERWNREKARLLYQTIDDRAGFYRCPVERSSRSAMNVVFRLPSEDLEARFVKQAEQQQMIGLKGHRSVGGIRVSSYNAVQVVWVEALCRFMEEFARTNG